jgi:hypothetical protein
LVGTVRGTCCLCLSISEAKAGFLCGRPYGCPIRGPLVQRTPQRSLGSWCSVAPVWLAPCTRTWGAGFAGGPRAGCVAWKSTLVATSLMKCPGAQRWARHRTQGFWRKNGRGLRPKSGAGTPAAAKDSGSLCDKPPASATLRKLSKRMQMVQGCWGAGWHK